jgi:hypothetical protein
LFTEVLCRFHRTNRERPAAFQPQAHYFEFGCIVVGFLVGVRHHDGEGEKGLRLRNPRGIKSALVEVDRIGHHLLITIEKQGKNVRNAKTRGQYRTVGGGAE